jgi:hypothetical protein
MKSKAIRHEIVNKAGASHVYAAKKRAPRLAPTNKNLVPKRIAFVAALVPNNIFSL